MCQPWRIKVRSDRCQRRGPDLFSPALPALSWASGTSLLPVPARPHRRHHVHRAHGPLRAGAATRWAGLLRRIGIALIRSVAPIARLAALNAVSARSAATVTLTNEENLQLLNKQRNLRPSSPHFTIYVSQSRSLTRADLETLCAATAADLDLVDRQPRDRLRAQHRCACLAALRCVDLTSSRHVRLCDGLPCRACDRHAF